MFKNRRLEELERKIRLLDEDRRCMWAMFRELEKGDFRINTFEYGSMPIKEVVRKLADEKEEEAEKRRMLEVAEKNFEDTRDHITLEVSVDTETAHKAIEEYKRRIKEDQERKKRRDDKNEAENAD